MSQPTLSGRIRQLEQELGGADRERASAVEAIPSALPMAALMTKASQAHHPGIEMTILSQSSIEILRQLEAFSLDVGLTYLDNEPSTRTG